MDQYGSTYNMDLGSPTPNQNIQSMWSREKSKEKEKVRDAARKAKIGYIAEGYSEEDAETKTGLAEKERQYEVSKRWIDHVVLRETLPMPLPGDLTDWNKLTNNEQDIPSLYDFCDIVGEVLIRDQKAKEFDACMISSWRIFAIKEFLANGTPIFVENSETSRKKAAQKQASLKHQEKDEERSAWDYKPGPEGQELFTGQYIELENGMVQCPNVLYRRIKEKSPKWKEMEKIYDGLPGMLKVQAPVTAVEEIRPIWIMAHIEEVRDKKGNTKIVHHGRDATYKRLQRGLSSEITKDFIESIADRCPGCRQRREKAKKAAEKAEPLREKKRAVKRGSNSPDHTQEDSGEEERTDQNRAKRRKANLERRQALIREDEQQQPLSSSMANFNAQNQVGQSYQFDEAPSMASFNVQDPFGQPNQFNEASSMENFDFQNQIRQPYQFNAANDFNMPQEGQLLPWQSGLDFFLQPEEVQPATEMPSLDMPYGVYNHVNIGGQILPTYPDFNIDQTNVDNPNVFVEGALLDGNQTTFTDFLPQMGGESASTQEQPQLDTSNDMQYDIPWIASDNYDVEDSIVALLAPNSVFARTHN